MRKRHGFLKTVCVTPSTNFFPNKRLPVDDSLFEYADILPWLLPEQAGCMD